MTASLLDTMRRGACPTLSAPMRTGDGYLSRVALTGPVAPQAIIELCRSALRHGSGLIDISARGNLQARGLTDESAGHFETDIRALGLPLRSGIAIDTGPLAGLDSDEIRDPRSLADAIREGAERLELAGSLAPKTAVVVDGGGRIALGDLLADIRLRATEDGWLLFTGGTEQPQAAHALLATEDAARAAALALLAAMAAQGRRFRGRDFTAPDVRQITGIDTLPPNPSTGTPAAGPFGTFALKDGQIAFGLGPAFGQMRAETLIALMQRAQAAGCRQVRPAPGHALLLFAPAGREGAIAAIGRQMGLIIGNGDPRAAIAACPGQPGCASAHFDTHALANIAAQSLPASARGTTRLHISGCAKGCAHPEPAAITLSGAADGIHLILDGKASDAPAATFNARQAPDALRRAMTNTSLSKESP